MTCWEWLKIEPTKDENTIKKAFSVQSKMHHPEDHPEEFKELRSAYKLALSLAKRELNEGSGVFKIPPQITFMLQQNHKGKVLPRAAEKPEEEKKFDYDFDSIDREKKEQLEAFKRDAHLLLEHFRRLADTLHKDNEEMFNEGDWKAFFNDDDLLQAVRTNPFFTKELIKIINRRNIYKNIVIWRMLRGKVRSWELVWRDEEVINEIKNLHQVSHKATIKLDVILKKEQQAIRDEAKRKEGNDAMKPVMAVVIIAILILLFSTTMMGRKKQTTVPSALPTTSFTSPIPEFPEVLLPYIEEAKKANSSSQSSSMAVPDGGTKGTVDEAGNVISGAPTSDLSPEEGAVSGGNTLTEENDETLVVEDTKAIKNN